MSATLVLDDVDARFVMPEPDPGSVALDETRQARLARIVGKEGLARLRSASVMVLGLGGVGSNCVEALARGGVGRLVIVDHDAVQPSNINRQAIAFQSTVGKPKVEVMAAMIADIDPETEVLGYRYFLSKDNVADFVAGFVGQVDFVVDAIDTVSTKLALAAYADALSRGGVGRGKMAGCKADCAVLADGTMRSEADAPAFALISSMGAANKLHPERFAFADLYDTVNCPLCRVMRKEGRKRGIRSLEVLYSSEEPVRCETAEGAVRQQRSDLGTMSYVPAIMGQMIAGRVIRQIVGM